MRISISPLREKPPPLLPDKGPKNLDLGEVVDVVLVEEVYGGENREGCDSTTGSSKRFVSNT